MLSSLAAAATNSRSSAALSATAAALVAPCVQEPARLLHCWCMQAVCGAGDHAMTLLLGDAVDGCVGQQQELLGVQVRLQLGLEIWRHAVLVQGLAAVLQSLSGGLGPCRLPSACCRTSQPACDTGLGAYDRTEKVSTAGRAV